MNSHSPGRRLLAVLCAVLPGCALQAADVPGVVVSWKSNEFTRSFGSEEFVAIVDGATHTLALRSDGTVKGWGSNAYGQTNIPASLGPVSAVAAGYAHNLALKPDGSVKAWGLNTDGQTDVPAGLSAVAQVSAGRSHSLALLSNGTVVAWGDKDFGQTTLPEELSDVTAIAAGTYHSLALRSDGTVTGWGRNDFGQVDVPPTLSDVIAIAAGTAHSLALRSDGTVVGWSTNLPANADFGQATRPAGLSNVIAIAAGGYHSLALQANGRVVGWGDNASGLATPPSGLTNAIAITATASRSSALIRGVLITVHPRRAVALLKSSIDFEVQAAGKLPLSLQWTFNGQEIPGATNTRLALTNLQAGDAGLYAVRVSNEHGSVLTRPVPLQVFRPGGTVVGWGLDDFGQAHSPPGLTNVISVACGWKVSLAMQADGTVVGWGDPWARVDTVPPGLSNVVEIAMGRYHAAALKRDGTVVVWGDRRESQPDVRSILRDVVAIGASDFYTLALKTDGTVVELGAETFSPFPTDFRPLSSPAGVGDIMAISTDSYRTLGMRSDGTVVSWGGVVATNLPPDLTNVAALAACNLGAALRRDGAVVSWQPGDTQAASRILATNVAIVAGREARLMALRQNGTVIPLGGLGFITGSERVTNAWALALGIVHDLAVTDTPPPPPTLGVTLSVQNIVLSWPRWAEYYLLETSETLGDSPIWTVVPLKHATTGSSLKLALPRSDAQRYFRLRLPSTNGE